MDKSFDLTFFSYLYSCVGSKSDFFCPDVQTEEI